jgi:autotransporter strand-loop-strand O-heptosyltransferase
MSLTQKKFHIKNVANLVTSDWNEIFNYMYHSEFFIGLSSGLSWVNWALNKKTVMIAGFSKNDHEFQNNVVRVSNNVCINCWNDNVFVFDNGDWDWCPVYKGTENQHICQKSITPTQVFEKIKSDLLT